MVYSPDGHALRFDVGRSDVVDHPPAGNYRLSIGWLELVPVGQVTKSELRLDLWNAEIRGTVTTDQGSLTFRAFTHARDLVTVVDLTTTGVESGCRWVWHSEPAVDPRQVYRKETVKTPNPVPTESKVGDAAITLQPLAAGGEYAVGRLEQAHTGGRTLYFTVASTFPGQGAAKDATDALAKAQTSGVARLATTHQAWWHAFWPQAFVSVPDARVEGFYWMQIYKLASATRADRPAIDLMGPWFRTTPWPAIWWNLNLQLTYWPVYAANRLELGESLTRMIDRGRDNLIVNVKPEWRDDSAGVGRVTSYDCRGGQGSELGNLTWALHNYWLQYRYSADEAMLRERLYPLLKRAVGLYLHNLATGPDGKLHLPLATSPEYPTQAPDTNYDHSLLRWGLHALLAANDRLKLDDPLAPKWRETLANLAPYPTDATGLMIGAGVPLAISHRHFSHLLMVYPLHLLSGDQPDELALIDRSLKHWIGFEGALQGYSFTGASAISSTLGRGDDALKYLQAFLDRFVKPNTMYLEAGPVIETPLSAAQSVHEMLLQSWSSEIGTQGRLRVFPAVPAAWPDVTFRDLRAEGGFLVSASRRGGATRWVGVTSLAGEPCTLQTDLPAGTTLRAPRGIRLVPAGAPGTWSLALRKGESAVLLAPGETEAAVAMTTEPSSLYHSYGSPKPKLTTQAADGTLDCPASRANLYGDTVFYEKGGEKDNIGHWVDGSDWVNWRAEITRPGRFQVILAYGLPGTGDGSRMEAQIGDTKLPFTAKGTGGFAKVGEQALGEVALAQPGQIDLAVRCVELRGGVVMNLYRLKLVPVGPQVKP